MDQFTKEGRKLRPRKTREQSGSFEKVEYRSEGRSSNHSEGRPRRAEGRSNYGESRGNYGEHRSNFGEGRPRRTEGRSNYGESRGSYGEHRSNFGEGRPRRSEGRSSYGESRGSYGEHRSSFGEGRSSRPQGGRGGAKPGASRGGFSKGGYSKGGSRPGFQNRRPGAQQAFGKSSYEGISRMINRRPVVKDQEGIEEYVSPIRDEVRLNKFIANSGVCSRREADTLIQAGVVTVNGQVVTELGTKVNIHSDDIRFNGERLKGEDKVYIIMNKPKGYVTTASDPHADKTVMDLIKNCPVRVYPVGRLDKNTTGVLMLTNDGEIAERLTHPSFDKKKIYQVLLDKPLKEEDYNTILTGVTLSDGEVKADELEFIDPNDKGKIGIEIHSGKNRVVRRIFESLGYNVKALDRVYFAGLTKQGLKKGEWRFLTTGETNILKMGAYV
ncbi:MAG: pseudouridine synthase [Bacteroidales bacterium]|nr:pseudouridine synthase [Bacteroidales bacterium]MBQ2006087.1 pseudouridine synthase [Bacteroidales bacterium]